MLDIENAKKQATTLAEYLLTVGKKLKHTHALEAVARMNGHKSWNTYQADASAVKLKDLSTAPAVTATPVLCGQDLADMFASGDVDHVLLDGCRYELRYYNGELLDSYHDVIMGLDSEFSMDDKCVEFVRSEDGKVWEEELNVEQLSNASHVDGIWTLGDGKCLQLFTKQAM